MGTHTHNCRKMSSVALSVKPNLILTNFSLVSKFRSLKLICTGNKDVLLKRIDSTDFSVTFLLGH